MNPLLEALGAALNLLISGDAEFWGIVGRSLLVNTSATLGAALIALPLAALLAMYDFRGKGLVLALVQVGMALPPVFVGLLLYMLLSRQGPLGDLGLLYTRSAMIWAQFLLVTPLIMANAYQSLVLEERRFADQFAGWGLNVRQRVLTLLIEARLALFTAVITGFGRALAEVGAVMIVGGNIRHATRLMTTSIALETSKGELGQALALGIVLVTLALGLVLLMSLARRLVRGQSLA